MSGYALKLYWSLQNFACIIIGQDKSFSQTCPMGVTELTIWRGTAKRGSIGPDDIQNCT